MPGNAAEARSESTRAAQRQTLKTRRAAMSARERAVASAAILRHIAATRWLGGQRRVGIYVATATEVDTSRLRALARRRHCSVYLPRILPYRSGALVFGRDRGLCPSTNRFGIGEPAATPSVNARWLSLLFLPVIGFDASGTRLGSGAGYFDRTLDFLRYRRIWHRPALIGLAFRCQQLPSIERRPHDVPLDAVVTEDGILLCSGSARQ